ncbi:MAG: hypothetical protein WC264_01775 [Candidatus Paceibacterota bacterium]
MKKSALLIDVFLLLARPNFAKTKRGASGGFLPRPLLLRLRHPNSEKRNQPKFCGILSPENCFRKTSSALFQISSSGLLSKKVRILYNEYRNIMEKISINKEKFKHLREGILPIRVCVEAYNEKDFLKVLVVGLALMMKYKVQ